MELGTDVHSQLLSWRKCGPAPVYTWVEVSRKGISSEEEEDPSDMATSCSMKE